MRRRFPRLPANELLDHWADVRRDESRACRRKVIIIGIEQFAILHGAATLRIAERFHGIHENDIAERGGCLCENAAVTLSWRWSTSARSTEQ